MDDKLINPYESPLEVNEPAEPWADRHPFLYASGMAVMCVAAYVAAWPVIGGWIIWTTRPTTAALRESVLGLAFARY